MWDMLQIVIFVRPKSVFQQPSGDRPGSGITNFDISCSGRYACLVNVSLTPELEQLVNRKVSSGMYQTASEVVREGLRLLAERDQRLKSLRSDIRAGFATVGRGEYTDYDATGIKTLARRVKSRGRRRLAAERAKFVLR
jgi:antitoxin ParD1/3/4